MDHHVKEFYKQSHGESADGHFHRVIPLHEAPDVEWAFLHKHLPRLPRGWYELAHLSPADRIEFHRDYWEAKLPYHPLLQEFLNRFFASLDDIGIFITQQKFDDPYDAHLVYSLKGDGGFFRGSLPATDDDLVRMQRVFPNIIFPQDYLTFLQIHNGFNKTTDATGIIASQHLKATYEKFQTLITSSDPVTTNSGATLDPKTLIPFYESFGMPFFQCFWVDWYPQQEMGNVYYSALTKTISDPKEGDAGTDNMAFPDFISWLMFYLERIA